jgi:hypothetical protein
MVYPKSEILRLRCASLRMTSSSSKSITNILVGKKARFALQRKHAIALWFLWFDVREY